MSALAVATGPTDRERDDLDLVAGVRAGDDRAFEVLYLRYQPRITAYVAGMVRDHGRAEDITQEVFLSALRRLREGDEREILFRPWIYEIAKNKCIDAYRRGRNTTELSFDAHDQVGAAEHGRLAEPGTTPDTAVEGKLAFDNLRGAFGGLSSTHHDILVLREFEGLSYREIGERLGMSRPAVESTLFRARKRLGEEYEDLVTGKRCVRVQRIVEDVGARATGLRDQRRVSRHLAHCQACRRHAYLAGVDLERPVPSVAARVAAFLPLPAFLRRRAGGDEEVAHSLSQHAARPVAQWTAQVASTIDLGTVSGWAKLAATAATVAVAGVGGAAIEHRASLPPAPAGSAAAPAAADAAAPAAPRRVAPGAPLPADVAANGPRAVTPATAAGEQSGRVASSTSRASHAGGADQASRPARGAVDPQRPLATRAPAPLTPVEGTATGIVAPALDAVGGVIRRNEKPVGSTGSPPLARPGGLLGGLATQGQGVAGQAPAGNGPGTAPGLGNSPGGGPIRNVVGNVVSGLRDRGASAADNASTGSGGSVLPSVSESHTTPTAAPPNLGG